MEELEWPQEPFRSKFAVRGHGEGQGGGEKRQGKPIPKEHVYPTHLFPRPTKPPSPTPSPTPHALAHALPTHPPARPQDALRNMEMPRFTRRYPAILDTLIKQMLGLAREFEEKLAAAEQQQQQKQQ